MNANIKTIKKACTVVYPHLVTPYAFDPSQQAKYEVTMVIPKTDKAFEQNFKAAIDAAIKEKWANKAPSNLRLPLLVDGDEKTDKNGKPIKAFANSWLLKAKSNKQPLLIDHSNQPIEDEDEIYSGCKCGVIFNTFAYEKPTKGISLSVSGIKKLADGERLFGGKKVKAEDFLDFDDDVDTATETKDKKYGDWDDIQ